MPVQLIWLILILPLLSFAVIALLVRPLAAPGSRLSGYIAITAIGAALLLSIATLVFLLQEPGRVIDSADCIWLQVGQFSFSPGLLVDPLTAVMLVVVTAVSWLVQIYSQGYMRGDPGYHRYYAWMSLFTASMLGLVLSDNLLMMYLFWELVGLSSYLLIGFWFQRPSAVAAAKKAFVVTRLGDFGFLAAILILYTACGTFDLRQLEDLAREGALAGAVLTVAALGIFAGAAGKSAQFPLHVWLPDAMEGPTPVSALIHAATMVAAGVFLVARTLPLFEHSAAALQTVAVIGAFTAIMAASMGLVAVDIKRVLAYSTISQLGYMMLGLAAGGVAVGIFHLFNHAFFKALLFLGSGSVNHATGTFDMRRMGGLGRTMPWTCALFVIGSLSLAGIWPLAGFWSKDEILAAAWGFDKVLFCLALVTVFLTAFYMFRAIFLTFGGQPRGADESGQPLHSHESPRVMLIPMLVLAVPAVISGFWNTGGGFNAFLGEAGAQTGFFSGLLGILGHPLPLISLAVALAGIGLAWAMYSRRWISAQSAGRLFRPLYLLLVNKYWLDSLYENGLVKRCLQNGLFAGLQWLDRRVIDGATHGTASVTLNGGSAARRVQTGQTQFYALTMIVGITAIAVVLLVGGR